MTRADLEAKRGYAEMLFLEGNTQKAIAAKVGVTEKTITRWKEEGEWDQRMKFENNTRKRALADLYAYLNQIRKTINDRDENFRYPDSKEADVIMKLTASINRLEEETTLEDVSVIGKELTLFVSQHSQVDAKLVAEWYDRFVKYKIKTRA